MGTLIGRPRRERFVRAFPRNGVGVEVGVFRGEFTGHLISVAQPRELHLIDGWWKIFGEFFPDWGPYTDFGRLRTRDAYDDAQRAVREAGADSFSRFHIEDRLVVLAQFPDDYFDWAYLDTSHQFEDTRAELRVLETKVRESGVIAGDDWHEDPSHVNHGVCRAVREFVADSPWQLEEIDSFGQWRLSQGQAGGSTPISPRYRAS